MKTATVALAFIVAWIFILPTGWAQTSADKEHAELAKALKGAKISLQRGLTASAKEGKPISAKYEVEDGKLQLSVYTMKGDTFSEVIVDHTMGQVAKVEPITGGGDLTAATAQRAAMTRAKKSLQTVVDAAVKAHAGMRAVSVFPALKGEHAVAEITLSKNGAFMTVAEPLE